MFIYDDGDCVSRNFTTISYAKFGDFGGQWGQGAKYVVESAIFGIVDPDLPIRYAMLWGYNDD